MTRKCDYCGKTFTPRNKTQRFCSDPCRKKAFREKQQEERKMLIEAYRAKEKPKPKPEPRHRWLELPANHPFNRMLRAKAKSGNSSFEYWEAFQEYDQLYCGGSSVVNGVSTIDPLFSESVMYSIEELGVVKIEKLGGGTKQ